MSFASSRIPTQQSSVNIGEVIQLPQDAGVVLPLTLVSGALTPLTTLELNQGVYTGYIQITLSGDNTTDFDYFNIVEDNEGGATNTIGAYLVATILPNAGSIELKYPITRFVNSTFSQNEIVLSVQSVFAGTAPQITAVYTQLIKVV